MRDDTAIKMLEAFFFLIKKNKNKTIRTEKLHVLMPYSTVFLRKQG